jgi:hypothetical protein
MVFWVTFTKETKMKSKDSMLRSVCDDFNASYYRTDSFVKNLKWFLDRYVKGFLGWFLLSIFSVALINQELG